MFKKIIFSEAVKIVPSQQTNKCSKSTIETLEEGAKYFQKYVFIVNFEHIFRRSSSVFIVDFEQIMFAGIARYFSSVTRKQESVLPTFQPDLLSI